MWKFIQGTDNKAIVTSDGRVFRRRKMYAGCGKKRHTVGWSEFREVKPWLSSGYLSVTIPTISYSKNCSIHRLVAEAFIPNSENKPCVDHIDGDRTNNNLTNLRWVTSKENINNPNTRWKGRKVWSYIQGFNPKSNFRTPVFKNRREASNWITPQGKKINPVSLGKALRQGRKCGGYHWTAKQVTGEEYQDIIST